MILARDLAEALDPARWAARVLGHVLDGWQADLLRGDYARVLLNIHRQGGKSTAAGLLALHIAKLEPESLVLLLSPAQRQSAELLRTVAGFYGADEAAIGADSQSVLKLELSNGSRILSLPGQEKTVRGYAGVRLLVIDEAARVPDELYYSVRPMLAVSGGALVAMSTPFGKRGWWYEAWVDGGPAWHRVRVKADKCPRISAAFLAEERGSMGEWWFKQEYGCEFADAQDAIFLLEDIERALTADIRPLFGGA